MNAKLRSNYHQVSNGFFTCVSCCLFYLFDFFSLLAAVCLLYSPTVKDRMQHLIITNLPSESKCSDVSSCQNLFMTSLLFATPRPATAEKQYLENHKIFS